ncbi:MAG: DUF1501 domain-containing protein [Verrucomicrobia bacterium]|nr:DUF1501 domain-containing protein [Verrucomicrobiota bacterium]MBI3871173.1 DUF1501 domain-containing protein [Verrucomicrobiota bacterium]
MPHPAHSIIENPREAVAPLSRRAFLRRTSAGLLTGGLSLHAALRSAAAQGGAQVLAPSPSHSPARARRLLFVFLTGGFSHVDTFDYKPRLQALHGQRIPAFGLRADETRQQPLLGSPFEFQRCGRSGLWISDLFPRLQGLADDLCVIRSLHTDIVEHFQATLAMHTGSSTVPMPSIGSWLSHGLGTMNPNLPPYVVMAEHLPYAGAQVFDSNFLPPQHQGVRIIPGEDPIPNLRPPEEPSSLAELERRMLENVNEAHARRRPADLNLAARMGSFEIARGMMREAPSVFDLAGESPRTLEAYGVNPGDKTSFAWQCLMARRLVERGVRVVELIDTGSHDNWDSHGDMQAHRPKAARVDRALAAMLGDLKARGLLDDTLVAICTEFGRTPWTDASNGKGRNHFAKAFTCLLAGGGARGGVTHGETDEFGASIVKNPVHVHDYHATLLHLMGLDHTRLTYRYAGRDFRLTDVSGEVIRDILA